MGFSKWILTHGIGSPGAIAKSMAKSYMHYKKMMPFLSHEQLLGHVAGNRIDLEKRFGVNTWDIETVLKLSEGDLKKMVNIFVFKSDLNLLFNLPLNTYRTVQEVISEVVDKHTR
jgi:hypothetical protein